MSKAPNIRLIAPNEYLCLQGEPSTEIYILKSGSLEILLVDAEGVVSEQKVKDAGMLIGEIKEPNTFIGEIGAILGQPRSASIRASERTEVQVVPVADPKGFATMVLNNRKLSVNLSKTIAQRLGLTSRSLVRSDQLSVKVREKLLNYSKAYFEVVDQIETIAKTMDATVESLGPAKQNIIFSLGRMVAEYNSVGSEFMASLCHHFLAHDDLFQNRRISADTDAPPSAPRPNEKVFQSGEMVCRPGEPDRYLYLLLEGKLETTVGTRPIEVIEGRGEIFGEMALFGDAKRTSGIRALTEVRAMPVPAAGIEAFLMQKPQLMLHLLRGFAKRLPMINDATFAALSQMALLVDLLALGKASCLSAFHGFNAVVKEDSSVLDEQFYPAIQRSEEMESALQKDIEEIDKQYQEICQAVGYKRRSLTSQDFAFQSLQTDDFEVVKSFEDLERLECEHIHFVWNVKTNRLYACSANYTHKSLLAKLKIPDTAWKDLIVGRLHNHGDNPPAAFVTIDKTALGTGSRTMEEIKDFLSPLVQVHQYELCALHGADDETPEILFIADHVKMEGGELVDEATIGEILEKFQKDPEDREALEKLNALYWDLIIATIVKQLPKVKDDVVPFEEDQMKLVNFGLMRPEFIEADSNVPGQIERDAKFDPGDDVHKYMLLTDFIQLVYREAFGANKLADINEQRKQLQDGVTQIENRIEGIKKGREQLVLNFPTGKNALPLVQKFDEVQRRLGVLDRKMRAGGQLTPEERGALMALKNTGSALGNQLTQFLNTLKGKVEDAKIQEFRKLAEEAPKRQDELAKAKVVLAQKDEEIAVHKKWMKNVSLKNKETAYRNEIIRLKKYVQMAAKKCKAEPIAVLYKTRDIATRASVQEVAAGFLKENIDSYIYDPQYNPRVKKAGPPSILLVPGTGISVYDWDKNAYIVPLCWPKSLTESLANGFIEYHWDIDEDKALRESFAQIKIYKKLPFTKMKEALMKDYAKWVTKEAEGMKVLDKEVRQWFKTRIAHEKVQKDQPAG